MYLNMTEDDKTDFENRKSEIEYGGMFSGPEVYMHIKGIAKEQRASNPAMDFQIVRDTSAFTERLNKALAGEEVFSPDRPDIAEKVKSRRLEIAKNRESSDPRIYQYPPSDGMDELVIERKPNG